MNVQVESRTRAGRGGLLQKALEQVEPRTPVGATTTPGDGTVAFRITRPGSYYLVADVEGAEGTSGIEIEASRVSLDLNGFAIVGVATSLDGIRVASAATADVSVRGGSVRGWSRNGVDLSLATDVRCRDLVVSNNGVMGLVCGARAGIVDCAARANGDHGIQTGDASTIHRSTVRDNGIYGIVTGAGSTIADCLARGNGFYGISGGEGSTVRGCTASSNGNAGIGAGDGSLVTDCTASFNSALGIGPGSGSTTSNCTATGNAGDGIRPGQGATISGCTARENGGSGIQVAENCRVVDNVCDGNAAAGVRTLRTGSRIEENSVTGNARGLEIRGASNTVRANIVRGNEENFDIVPGNHLEILLSELPVSLEWPASVVLAGSLTGVAESNGITIGSSDVTIDLAGHALVGVPGSLSGIEVARDADGNDPNGIRVRNGFVRGWGAKGIDASDSEYGDYRDLHLSSNGTTAFDGGLLAGDHCIVTACTSARNAGVGIGAGNCVIADCCANGNGNDGIVGSGTLRGCTATGNQGSGFGVGSGTIQGCTAIGNEGSGFEVGNGTTIEACVAARNTRDGISLSSECRVVGNQSSSNLGAGIHAGRSRQRNHIEANTVTENLVGIQIESSLNLVVRNVAAHNGDFDPITGGPIVDYDVASGNSFVPAPLRLDDDDTHPYANLSF